jgi:phosphate acyltransferase
MTCQSIRKRKRVMQLTHIFVDAMGGDNAPQSTVQGALDILRRDPELRISLAGVPDAIAPGLADGGDVMDRLTVVDAPEIITNHDAPVIAVRSKKHSSIVMGMLAVKEGKAHGFVSAGSTGAVLAGGMFRLGRLPGIDRPALAPLLPKVDGYYLLLDCGANVDCQPEWLVQFGIMGDAYMRCVMNVSQPRVGLANIGAEAEKGNALCKAAYPLMERAGFRFIGNVEGRDIPSGTADVLVCDGFSGNLLIKFMEGVAGTLLGMIKKELMADTRGKIGGMIAKPAFSRVKRAMDYTEVGGAPLLGVQGVVVKAHGSSNARAMAQSIAQAALMARGGVAGAIAKQLGMSDN